MYYTATAIWGGADREWAGSAGAVGTPALGRVQGADCSGTAIGGRRMNLLVLGEERFRIQTLEHDRPYLAGTVEPFPLRDPRPEETAIVSQQLRPLLVAYLHLLSEAGNVEFDPTQLPAEPVALAFLGAALLQAPPERKQELLACENATRMLTRMCSLLRQEMPLLRLMLQNEAGKLDSPGGFSPN